MYKECGRVVLQCGVDKCEPFNQGSHLCGVVCWGLCPIPAPHRGPQCTPCVPHHIPARALSLLRAPIKVQLGTPVHALLSGGMLRSFQYHIPVYNHRLLDSFPCLLEPCWGQGLHQAIQGYPVLGELEETFPRNPLHPEHAQIDQVGSKLRMHMS